MSSSGCRRFVRKRIRLALTTMRWSQVVSALPTRTCPPSDRPPPWRPAGTSRASSSLPRNGAPDAAAAGHARARASRRRRRPGLEAGDERRVAFRNEHGSCPDRNQRTARAGRGSESRKAMVLGDPPPAGPAARRPWLASMAGVAMGVGRTAFAVIPRGRSSAARTLPPVALSADLATVYAAVAAGDVQCGHGADHHDAARRGHVRERRARGEKRRGGVDGEHADHVANAVSRTVPPVQPPTRCTSP